MAIFSKSCWVSLIKGAVTSWMVHTTPCWVIAWWSWESPIERWWSGSLGGRRMVFLVEQVSFGQKFRPRKSLWFVHFWMGFFFGGVHFLKNWKRAVPSYLVARVAVIIITQTGCVRKMIRLRHSPDQFDEEALSPTEPELDTWRDQIKSFWCFKFLWKGWNLCFVTKQNNSSPFCCFHSLISRVVCFCFSQPCWSNQMRSADPWKVPRQKQTSEGNVIWVGDYSWACLYALRSTTTTRSFQSSSSTTRGSKHGGMHGDCRPGR